MRDVLGIHATWTGDGPSRLRERSTSNEPVAVVETDESN